MFDTIMVALTCGGIDSPRSAEKCYKKIVIILINFQLK